MTEHGVVVDPQTVRFERLLPAPIERVWSYLTDSGKLATWLAAGELQQHVGGRVELVFRLSELTGHDDPAPSKYAQTGHEVGLRGVITAWRPPYLLSYTWSGERGVDSEVTFELTPRGDAALLVVTHRRLTTRDEMISVAAGWHTHLDFLLHRVEGRRPLAFWSLHTRMEAEYEGRVPINLQPGSEHVETNRDPT
jgi:uncharacterized protein YndB with AHSA1/START domain